MQTDHPKPINLDCERRIYEYSVDHGAHWWIVVSTIGDDTIEAVRRDLSERFACEVMVRERGPR